jgi:hypothetical protein
MAKDNEKCVNFLRAEIRYLFQSEIEIIYFTVKILFYFI